MFERASPPCGDFKSGTQPCLRWNQIADGKVIVFNVIQYEIFDLPIEWNEVLAIEPAIRNRRSRLLVFVSLGFPSFTVSRSRISCPTLLVVT